MKGFRLFFIGLLALGLAATACGGSGGGGGVPDAAVPGPDPIEPPAVLGGLALVSPGISADDDPAGVEVFAEGSLGANFPLWYEDTNGLRLTLCLDGDEAGFPCAWEGSPVFKDNECGEPFYEYQEVVGFGDEAFYFKVQSFPFDVPLTGPAAGGLAQMQLLLETTWGEDVRFDPEDGTLNGESLFIEEEDGTCVSAEGADLHRVEPGYEMLFTRMRLRVLPGSPEGWYRMTYPYGVKTVFHPTNRSGTPDDPHRLDQRTEVRQLVGDLRVIPEDGRAEMQDFTIALNDADTLIDKFGAIPALANFIGLRETGFANDLVLRSIGPFLFKPDYLTDPVLQIEENGTIHQYIGYPPNEENPAASPGHKVLGSVIPDGMHESGFQNYFRIEFQAGDRNTQPNPASWVVVGFTEEFNVVGKVAQP